MGSLQNELAQTIAKQVGATTSASGRPERRIKPEAHDTYLLGRYYWFAGEYDKSRPYFQKAIDLQPDYAAAWSGLADSYIASAVSGRSRPEAVMPQGEAAAQKALELDASLAEAHNSVAAAYFFDRWDWVDAERESARSHGRSVAGPDGPGWALIHARRFDAALNEARIRVEAQPNNADLHALLSAAYLYKGMEKESEQESERNLQIMGEKELAAQEERAFHRGGFHATLEWNLSVYQQRAARRYVSPIDFAFAYAQLRRKEETLRYLEQAYEEHAPDMVWVQGFPDFDFVHPEPRYRAIIKKMGLPPAY